MTDVMFGLSDAAPARWAREADTSLGKIAARRPERRLTVAFSFLALLLGFLQAWDARFTMGRDAVSYLDIGDAYFRHDWVMALNGYFNPLYAWVLGFALHWARPTAYWEYPLVHLIDFLFYGFALYCFSLFLRELLRYREMLSNRRYGTDGILHAPLWVWIVLGYSIFMWSSLDLIEVNQTSPDMLIAALVYLIGALLLRIRAGSANWITFALLGAVCGLGYLTKAVFFPLTLMVLAVALFAAGKLRKTVPRVAISFMIFAVLAGPFVLALSSAKGRLTFGDTGRLNYAWYVNGTALRHWQGSPGAGHPLHPTRRLFERPATYEFGTPLGGTYPVWYDASYWYEGLRIHFSAHRQLTALWGNLRDLATLFLRLNGSLFLGILLLAIAAQGKNTLLKEISAYWFLIVPCAGALAMYALVTVDPRYVGTFIAIIALSVFCGIPLRDTPETRRLMAGVAIALLLMVLSPIGPSTIQHHYGSFLDLGKPVDKSAPWRVASEVEKLGIRPGDWVASVQYSKKNQLAWARLARVRIVAEVFYSPTMSSTSSNDFFRASPAVQNQIIEAFGHAGAKLIISDEAPPCTPFGARSAGNWQRLGETEFYVYSPTGTPRVEVRERRGRA